MPSFRSLGLSFGLLLAGLPACASDVESGGASPFHAGGSSGDTNAPESLEFEGVEGTATLTLAPSDVRTLRVVARPPGIYRVRFGLLGDPGDASLDRSEAETAPDGTAEVVLTAPKTGKLFTVRASVGTMLSANAVISVGKSFATVVVHPNYRGQRPVVYWVGSAQTGKTCADLVGNPPPDGDRVDQSLLNESLLNEWPTITDVPTGTTVAVTLRAAQYIGGCAVVTDLVKDQINDVVVPVTDVPVQVTRKDLELLLKIDATTANAGALFDSTETSMLGRLSEGRVSDVTTLLDAMADAADPAQRAGFVAQRSSELWDLRLNFALGISASTELRRPLRDWFATARRQLLEGEMLSGTLLTSRASGDTAELRLTRAFGHDPIAAGFSPALGSLFSVTAEPGDNLVIGGTLDWFPTQLLGRFVTEVAKAAVSGTSSVAEALASELSCDRIARELDGSDSTQVFPGCELECTNLLCQAALEDIWARMVDVTDISPAKLVLSATGLAKVDEYANVATVDGTWNADVDYASVTGKLAGGLEGSAVQGSRPTQ